MVVGGRYEIHDKGAYLLFLRCSGMCTPCDPINGFLYVSEDNISDQTVHHAKATRNRQAITVIKVFSGRQTGTRGEPEGVRSF
jgi:hypothetical protein